MQGIRSGVKLKDASQRKLAQRPPPSFELTFNMDKIIARREALEFSDNEDDDDWDADEW